MHAENDYDWCPACAVVPATTETMFFEEKGGGGKENLKKAPLGNGPDA